MRSTLQRGSAALLSLAIAGALLTPDAEAARQVSWESLISPLVVGAPVAKGYVLAPPRRGLSSDIVYVARRAAGPSEPAGHVEVHILDRGRWSGVAETRSFSIGWEAPRSGALVSASIDDANAVRDALADAIRRNDTGFPSVEAIPFASEPAAPLIARALERFAGVRGMIIGGLLTGALVLLLPLHHGALVVSCLLFALGLVLRGASLDVPFAHDQDVQRLFTGGLPLWDIVAGAGLDDRHPPLYFLLLHIVQGLGQSEAVNRAPAVLAGALAGPVLLWATRTMGIAIGVPALLSALAVTVAPELIAQSRQVSEIPLFALLLLVAATSLTAALIRQRVAHLVMVALSHALAMYTYYLTPFVWAAHAAILMWRRASGRVVAAYALGVVAGAPALLLGASTLLRDRGARDVARLFPALAWGEHTPLQLAGEMGRMIVATLGAPLVVLVLLAILVGMVRRQLVVIVPAAGAIATFVGIALLSPIARVQIYYITTTVPLLLLALAAAPEPIERPAQRVWRAALFVAVAFWTLPLLADSRSLYVPSGEAFMPRFAAAIVPRPETTVVTVAQYDKTILAYYLARSEGRTVGWHTIDRSGTKRLETLVQVHSLDADTEANALRRLTDIVRAGPALVIERDAFLLPRIVERLGRCELLVQAPTARLSRCTEAD